MESSEPLKIWMDSFGGDQVTLQNQLAFSSLKEMALTLATRLKACETDTFSNLKDRSWLVNAGETMLSSAVVASEVPTLSFLRSRSDDETGSGWPLEVQPFFHFSYVIWEKLAFGIS